ncbi:hypothetical protein IT41_20095, partial [Paracoccus halophilus]
MQARRREGLRSFPGRSCSSLCSLRQNKFAQRQIRNCASEPFILQLQPLQFLQLIHAHPTILLAP